MDERMDGRTNESPPMFYRTSSPLGPLPKNRHQKEWLYAVNLELLLLLCVSKIISKVAIGQKRDLTFSGENGKPCFSGICKKVKD